MIAVSVCMITFNQMEFIEEAVRSTLAQSTTFDHEVVVADDCSTDATPDILERLEREHTGKLRVIRRETNIGVNRNLAATLEAARGKYIALLEGDDYWTDPLKLQMQYDILEAHPEYAICFHRVRVRHDQGDFGRVLPDIAIPRHGRLAHLIERGNFIPTASMMFRKMPWTFPDWFYDLRIGDFPLAVMAARHGDIKFIDRVMAVYRLHSGGSFSAVASAARVEEVIRTYDHLNRYLEHRFSRTIAGIQSYWRAVESFERGDIEAARAFARARATAPPFNGQRMMAALMAYTPGLYRAVRATRPVLQ